MKKIININFHGRVVPIEETAYDILKQYIDSLRVYFAKEEGRDEIINDIENRFAELFSENLKRGSTCITDDDVNAIITNMGRPEDFDEVETEPAAFSSGKKQAEPDPGPTPNYSYQSRGRLYRNEDNKIIGGVCSGLGSYFNIDPWVMRLIFILLVGPLILPYLVLWVLVPSRSLSTRKRLYRNPDDRILGGVAGGLAAYFHIEVWIWRLIFGFPLLIGILTSIFRHSWFDIDFRPAFFSGGLGGSLIVIYLLLWAILPEANTASEKLEMRGEKVDLESIKNTIKSDLEGVKGRARDMGNDIKEKAQAFGQQVKQTSQNFTAEAGPVVRRTGSGLGHAIGILFKTFFFIIAGIIAFSLVIALAGLLFSGVGVLPFSSFLLDGFWQTTLAWGSLFLFFGIPVIALLTWLIRRIMGVRSRNNYFGYIYGTLWVVGLICLFVFAGTMLSNFRTRASVEDEWTMSQPAHDKLILKVNEDRTNYYESDWFGINWNGEKRPFYGISEDSIKLTTIRVNLIKSTDSLYHVQRIRFSHGRNPQLARNIAAQIDFTPHQNDSVIYLPEGFAITPNQKFRNQQVLVIVAIPVGKKIIVDKNIDDYHWFDVKVSRYNRSWNVEWNDDWDETYNWSSNVEYIMTNDGLRRTDRTEPTDNEDHPKNDRKQKDGYRYKSKTDSTGGKSKELKSKPTSGDNSSDNKDDDNKETLVTPINNRLQAALTGSAPMMLSVLFQ